MVQGLRVLLQALRLNKAHFKNLNIKPGHFDRALYFTKPIDIVDLNKPRHTFKLTM